MEVPYRFNRGIVHHGDMPHLSTPVRSVTPSSKKRVIIGFNAFTAEVEACCARAPEHSDAFVATVRLYQRMGRVVGEGEREGKGKLTLDAVRANPQLAKVLIGLAREKRRQESLEKSG